MRWALILFSLFIPFSSSLFAQTTQISQSQTKSCNVDLFWKIEKSLNEGQSRKQIIFRFEIDLKEIVANCENYEWHLLSQKYLREVQEEIAEGRFYIANLYWNFYKKNKKIHTLKASQNRLIWIIEKYPNYSKINQVYKVLDEVNSEFIKMKSNSFFHHFNSNINFLK